MERDNNKPIDSGELINKLYSYDTQYIGGLPVENSNGKKCIGIEMFMGTIILYFDGDK